MHGLVSWFRTCHPESCKRQTLRIQSWTLLDDRYPDFCRHGRHGNAGRQLFQRCCNEYSSEGYGRVDLVPRLGHRRVAGGYRDGSRHLVFITQILKPEPITDECLQGIREQAAAAKKIEPYEIKAIIVVLGLLVLWIAGNWIPVLNATVVALIGLTVMFLPGMQLLSWKEFQDAVPWGIVLMCGTIMSLGSVIESTGGAAFLAGLITNSGVMSLSSFAALALMLAFVYILHTVCPIGVAILGIFLPIMITLCAGFGMSPAVPTIALAVVVAGNYLMPVNPTVMLTYGEGYYTFGDMFKTGIIPSIVLVLLMAAWMPFIVGILGI